jgi:hypothetical protein
VFGAAGVAGFFEPEDESFRGVAIAILAAL